MRQLDYPYPMPQLQVWLGALCISFAPICVKWITSLGPTSIGVYRLALASLLLLPLALRQGIPAGNARPWRTLLMGYLVAGALFAIDLYVWHRSVVLAGAGLSTILGNTQVFYLALAGGLLFGDKLGARFVLSVFAAFLGIVLLVRPQGAVAPGYWDGVAYGLATGAAYGGYLLSLRFLEMKKAKLPTTFHLALVCVSGAAFLTPVALWEGSLQWPSPPDWMVLVILAGLCQVGGWLLITRNLSHVPVSRVGLILLTQPVGATLWGGLFFGESFGMMQWMGAALTLAGIYGGSRPR